MAGQTWQYNGMELNTLAWSVVEISEGIGTPGLRGDNIHLPFQHGKKWIKKRYDIRIVMLPMWVRGLDPITGKLPSGLSSNEMLYQNIDYLSKVLGASGQHNLIRTLPSGEKRETKAEVYQPVIFKKVQDGYAKCVVEFLLSDPFFYSQQQVTETTDITSLTQEWTHQNPGTAPATKVDIEMIGPMESPKLECVETGVWLSYLGTIGVGETVTINTEDFSCEKDGLNMISSLKHGGDAYWMILSAGDSQLRLTNEITGGQVRIKYYPAYF